MRPIANRPLDRVPAPNGVDIGQTATVAGLSKAEFKTYNLGFSPRRDPEQRQISNRLTAGKHRSISENHDKLYAQNAMTAKAT